MRSGLPIMQSSGERSEDMGSITTTGDSERDEVVRRELLLLEPRTRSHKPSVLALLHPDFVEFGASGRKWDRESIADALSAEEASAGKVEVQMLDCVCLDKGAMLVSYRARRAGSVSLRSSVWVRHNGDWLIRFHQGTPIPDELLPVRAGDA